MNLLPDQYIERSRNKARSNRVAIAIICTLCAVAAIATHSRLSMNSSVERLVVTQSRANNALELEVDATELELKKDRLESFIQRYNTERTIFGMGDIVSTITNMLPDSVTLEDLSLDIVETENGRGISGRLAGIASTDESIASLVSLLQFNEPFGSVSMDYSKSRTVLEKQAREFRISFLIDLDSKWEVSRMIVNGGEE
jgi:Tfp pilus assembly protein PilN